MDKKSLMWSRGLKKKLKMLGSQQTETKDIFLVRPVVVKSSTLCKVRKLLNTSRTVNGIVVMPSRGWQVIDAERRCIEAFDKKGVLELQFGHNILYSPEGIVGGCR